MADYIKSNDHHHLLMDGNAGETRGASLFWQDLTISSVDLYTGHYYPPSVSSLRLQARLVHDADKVFIVGEYDWNTTDGDPLSSFLHAILDNKNVAGDMYWSLFPHSDVSGFVTQDEHYTLYYPGNTSDTRQRIQTLRTHAYAMQGLPVATKIPVGTPLVTSVHDHTVTWRGAFGADTYSLERSTVSKDGPWALVCDRCTTDFSGRWTDKTQPGDVVWYRIRGYSVSGVSGPYSNSAGS
jgi:mannan endo-1,4-beta-mannosidase